MNGVYYPNYSLLTELKNESIKHRAKAPEFESLDTEFNTVKLSEPLSQGEPVILLFFPLALSPVFTKEPCTFRDRIASLEERRLLWQQ